MDNTVINILTFTPVVAAIFAYHKYVMSKIEKKVDLDTFTYHNKIAEKNIYAILEKIEKRLDRIENKLMK